jgi:ABC-2 type transport system permease protein
VERLADAWRAEWTKLWTVPGTWPLLAAAVVLTVVPGAVAAATVTYRPGTDAVRTALTGMQLGQAVVAALGVTLFTGEHGTGMLRTTFAALPHRHVVLAAKALALGAAVLPAALAAVLGSLLAGRLLLPAAAWQVPSDGAVVRAAAGSVLYLVLVALLALGTSAVVRDPGGATGTVLALLYLFPLLAALAGDPHWGRHLQQAGPSTAGLSVLTTLPTDPHTQPIGPWPGLAVLAGWSAAALLAACTALRTRDA